MSNYIYIRFRPFKNDDDNDLGIYISHSLTLLFLSALLVGVSVVSEAPRDQQVTALVSTTFDRLKPISTGLWGAVNFGLVCWSCLSYPSAAEELCSESSSKGQG